MFVCAILYVHVHICAYPRFRNNTNELEISDVRPEDEGLYICHFKVNNVRQIQAAGCLIVDGELLTVHVPYSSRGT